MSNEILDVLEVFQSQLGASRAKCDAAGKKLWDRIETVKDQQMMALPAGKRERINFYEEAMRDPKNHSALALELAYLRAQTEQAA